METKTVKLDGYEFVVSKATIEQDIRRAILLEDAVKESDPVLRRVKFGYAVTAPAIFGQSVSLDEYRFFPSLLGDALFEAVRELNPNWFPELQETAPAKKKKN
jgi:hypothetical protein